MLMGSAGAAPAGPKAHPTKEESQT